MFDHHCTACDKRQLIFPSQVTSLVNTDHGIIVASSAGAAPSRPCSPAAPSTTARPSPPECTRERTAPEALPADRQGALFAFWRLRRRSVDFRGLPDRAARRLSSVGRATHS